MSFESSENQREISENEWQQLKEDAAYWDERIAGETKTPSKSYSHILLNLNTSLSGRALDLL